MEHATPWPRRDILGVHPQKQEGMFWLGASVPAGRITAEDLDDFARVAEEYGDGTARLTCEENILFTSVPEAKLAAAQADPLFARFSLTPGGWWAGRLH